MRNVRPDLTMRPINQLVDLRGEHRLHRRPRALDHRHPARLIMLTHPIRDRLVITPDQARRRPERARQVIRLQNLHHSLRLLHVPASRSRLDNQDARDYRALRTEPVGRFVAAHGEK
jgi:hypothetical protein